MKKSYYGDLKVAHSQMLKAISASKKKNDKVDARMIADLLRCDLLPECYMMPEDMRELRRILRLLLSRRTSHFGDCVIDQPIEIRPFILFRGRRVLTQTQSSATPLYL
jgi:hypothetical protein